MIRALVILLPAIVVLGLGYLLGHVVYVGRTRKLRADRDGWIAEARRRQGQLDQVRNQLIRIRELAETNQAIDPILSAQILAELTPTERNHP